MLVKHQQSACLPQRDVPVFFGDPLEFRSFMKASEHVVDSKIMWTKFSFWRSSQEAVVIGKQRSY